jgi:Probable Zinc-ribbon domain
LGADKTTRSRDLSGYPSRTVPEHPTRNPGIDPHAIAPGSERKIWWRCAECGNEWTATVNDRTRIHAGWPRPHGCPACAQARNADRQAAKTLAPRERSFGALSPHPLAEWHPTRNGDLDPYTIKPRPGRKVWWRCAECGQEWQTTPSDRSRSLRGGCRLCANTRAQSERAAKVRRATPRGGSRPRRRPPKIAVA